MFYSSNFSIIVVITALYFLQLWQHEVSAEDKCNQKSNKTCEHCVKDGCTFCKSSKLCMTFSLLNDTLHAKCKGQDWYYKQCSVNGKFLLIAVPVTCFVVLVTLGCTIYCCCCRGRRKSGCVDCIRHICCCCCCCCCDEKSSRSSGESFGILRGVRNPMTQGAASRIQSATAKIFGGGVPKGSFSSRAQSTADRRAYWNIY